MRVEQILLLALLEIRCNVAKADQRPWYVSVRDWENETGSVVPKWRICALMDLGVDYLKGDARYSYRSFAQTLFLRDVLMDRFSQTGVQAYPVAGDDRRFNCSWSRRWSRWTKQGRNRRKLLDDMITHLKTQLS